MTNPATKNRFTLKDTLALAKQFELDIESFLSECELQNLDHDRLNRLNCRDFCEFFEQFSNRAIPA